MSVAMRVVQMSSGLICNCWNYFLDQHLLYYVEKWSPFSNWLWIFWLLIDCLTLDCWGHMVDYDLSTMIQHCVQQFVSVNFWSATLMRVTWKLICDNFACFQFSLQLSFKLLLGNQTIFIIDYAVWSIWVSTTTVWHSCLWKFVTCQNWLNYMQQIIT